MVVAVVAAAAVMVIGAAAPAVGIAVRGVRPAAASVDIN